MTVFAELVEQVTYGWTLEQVVHCLSRGCIPSIPGCLNQIGESERHTAVYSLVVAQFRQLLRHKGFFFLSRRRSSMEALSVIYSCITKRLVKKVSATCKNKPKNKGKQSTQKSQTTPKPKPRQVPETSETREPQVKR